MRRATLLVAVLGLLVGCGGGSEQVRERDVVVGGPPTTPTDRDREPRSPTADATEVRIAVVTHGQAASGFWAIVKNGVDAAARETDVTAVYRSPDAYSITRMRQLIDQAVAAQPDGLVVSIPSPALGGAIRRAVRAGIPVVSVNSGSDVYRRLGVLAHVGQEEDRAGAAAGRRMAASGVRHAVCLNHEPGNVGPDTRCRSFVAAMRAAGARAESLAIDVRDPSNGRRQVRAALADATIDGVLTLSSDGAAVALDEVRRAPAGRKVQLGTFDLSPEILRAVKAGTIAWAIDQQAYLQGYLPVLLLAQRVRFGLFPDQGEVIATGPHFVTARTADQATRLSQQGIR
jgi:simple sugar transport system substrate-binding protein